MQRRAASEDKSVSDLLSALELRGQTWCYSDVGQDAGFSVAPCDAVLFHAVLHGSARIACASGAMIELGVGDAVIVLSGEAHALRTSAGSQATTHEFLRSEDSVDIPPSLAIGSGRIAARVLSGKLRATWPGEVNRATLPSLLPLGQGEGSVMDAGPLVALLRPEALPLAGIGAGSAALLTRLAAMMLVAGLRADPRCRQLFAPPRQDPIADALRLIETSPAANWTVERLARSVGMGRSNFAAHFTQQVGRAPMELVAEQRMEHAASLLRQGKLKIAEISEMAGYGSEAAFSRRFTRHFGISPSQMRDRARAGGEVKSVGPAFPPVLSGRAGQSAAVLARQRAPAASQRISGKPTPKAGILLGGKRD
ncbi:AraC family transcriptional regulator [Novosphingobium sp. G106]|uniref:AraC family transcriptional regulator n=1 Tax=Novosphingobium sp. G106 TaxID=2849500 RepID=UPI001C2CE844|nr:AraC family transcriptional regulator [Novosphingobium sp. G106]MBV1690497.1 AraC family transcriptional regulator [Novosphingobium sp. G106]